MRALSRHRHRSTRWLWLLTWALTTLGPTHSAWAQGDQKRILVLYSARRDAQLSVVGERELPRILNQGLDDAVDYYAEYIDLARFPDPQYQATFRDFLHSKYKQQRLDLVIALQDTALEFVVKNRSALFPETPLVYLASNGSARVANSTGLLSSSDFGQTLTLAMALQPDTTRVFVVAGNAAPDKAFESLARAQFQPFKERLAFSYLSGLSASELERRLAALPARSIVYYLLFYRDAAGENFHPLGYLDRLAVVANAPIYSWVDSTMGRGIVGGSLLQQEARIDAVAQLALRVLRGERADSIPTSTPNLNVSQVDWRQLQRWRISEARVPAGTLVMFREPNVLDRYKIYILGSAAFLLAQTALIAGLLVQRVRRRAAEEEVRESQAKLRASYERIRDLGGRLLEAQEAERARIARELHDDISQQAALVAINLQLLDSDPNQKSAEKLVREAAARAQSVAKSVHDLSHRLHPNKLGLVGLVAAISGLQRDHARPDVRLSFSHENVPASLPPALTLCLFRIAQEALQNADRHSGAHHVSLHLSGDERTITLTVVDDGAGFDVDDAWDKGLGLISMSQRLEPFGGKMTIRPERGGGTYLEVAVPFVAPKP